MMMRLKRRTEVFEFLVGSSYVNMSMHARTPDQHPLNKRIVVLNVDFGWYMWKSSFLSPNITTEKINSLKHQFRSSKMAMELR